MAVSTHHYSPRSTMGYDSMAAWDRFQCSHFHNQIQKRLVALSKPRSSQCQSSRRRAGVWPKASDLPRADHRALVREDHHAQLSPIQEGAPLFSYATSSWSPPHSPSTLSAQSSPASSPPQSPGVDSPHTSSPLTHTLPVKSAIRYADKVYAAACAGDLEYIDLLLGFGASVDAPTTIEGLYEAFKPAKSGLLSPCAGAAGNGQLHAVRHLLARGASLNPDVNKSSSSLLHEACRNNEFEVAQFLLAAGANVNLYNRYNSTPLMYAIKYGSPALVYLMMSYQPNLGMPSFIGGAAIHWAVFAGRNDVLKTLLVAGADVNHPNTLNGSTPLHCAAVCGQFGIVQCLLQHHADYTKEDQAGLTPLDIAEQNGHEDIAEIIKRVMMQRTKK